MVVSHLSDAAHATGTARARTLATAIVWFAALATAGVLGWRSLTVGANALVDLAVYRGAIAQAASGGSLYDYAYHSPSVRESGLPFTYPPFAALAFWPVATLPSTLPALVWVTSSLGAVAASVAYAARHERAGRPASWLGAGVLVLLALASYPFGIGLLLGQASPFVFALTLVDAVAPRRRGCGVLTGLAAAIKLTPLVFVALFLVRRDWRSAATAVGTFAAATVLGWLVLPGDSARYWGGVLWQTERVGELGEMHNKSLRGLLEHWAPGPPWVAPVWLILAAALTVAALWHARRLDAHGDRLAAAAVVGCLSVAVSPISWVHHLGWGVLAVWTLLRCGRPAWLLPGLALAYALSVAYPFADHVDAVDLTTRLGQEVATVVALLVAACGLPRSTRPRASQPFAEGHRESADGAPRERALR